MVTYESGLLQRSVLLMVSALTVASAPLSAQTLERDPGTGDYVLTFTDMDGNHYRVVIEPRDKVAPEPDVSIERSGTTFVYRYSLTNRSGPDTTQPISLMLLPCPHDDRELSVSPAPGWNAGKGGLNPFACRYRSGHRDHLVSCRTRNDLQPPRRASVGGRGSWPSAGSLRRPQNRPLAGA